MDLNVKDLISVPEAARRAGIAVNTMRLAARHGTIKAIKPGRNWLIDASDIPRWKREAYQPGKAIRHPPHTDTDDDPGAAS